VELGNQIEEGEVVDHVEGSQKNASPASEAAGGE
jgi:hypothetical protein